MAEREPRLSQPMRKKKIATAPRAECTLPPTLSDFTPSFRGIFDTTPDGMILMNCQGKIVLVNKQTEQLFGYTGQELQGCPIEVLLPQGIREPQGAPHADVFITSPPRLLGKRLELTGIHKNKREIPVEVSLNALEADEGVMLIAVVRNLSEQKQAEAALRESEDRFRQAFDLAAIGKAL